MPGAEVNADLERQTRLVQVTPDVAVERADRLKLRRVDQIFGHSNQTLVGVDLHLGRTDLAAVAEQSEMKLDEDRFLGQVGAWVLDIHDRRCCRHFKPPSVEDHMVADWP